MVLDRALRLCILLASAACLLGACSGGDEKSTKSPTVTLRVMTFNIFYGGDEMELATKKWCTNPEGCLDTFAAVADAIRRSQADVVGLQEATANTRKVAEELGWHFSERTHVISRYPIIDPGGADGLYVFVEPTPGRVVAISNVHLPATPYGPYQVGKGASHDKVIRLEERSRVPAIAPQVDELPALAEDGIPVLLTGDFNSPSHLDWTPAVDEIRDEIRYPVEWPVGKMLAEAGFRDSFRAVHPDPIERPGFTWTPGGPESVKDEVHDRIDWVLSAGPARAVESSVLGEADYEGSDIGLPQWPSDHRAVVSTFRVTAATMPEFVAVESRGLEQGETQHVRFHTEQAGAKVVVRPVGEVFGEGRLSIETESLAPGEYEVTLVDAQEQPITTAQFHLYPPGSQTTISTAKRVYDVGESIRVSWTNAPGMKWDWIGAFRAGDGADNPNATTCSTGYCGNGNYLAYKYTKATVEGSTTLGARLKPGTYDVRLLLDDGYTRAAISESFKIKP